MKKLRQIKFYKKYFLDFYVSQTDAVRNKINYVFGIIESQQFIPTKFLRRIEGTDGLYEIRVEVYGNIFRIFCCMDSGSIVVLFNGFQKKTQKTPSVEIRKAIRIMNEYINN